MDNLWTNINDNIPMYMSKICKEYNLVCVKISPLKTAMIGDEFAIMIAIDRFDIEIYYLYKRDPDMGKYIYIKNCLLMKRRYLMMAGFWIQNHCHRKKKL